MGLGQYHGERAFEAFLRARRMPYVSVNEARRTLVSPEAMGGSPDLKSFDFVVYTAASSAGRTGANLLVDVKCRRLPTPRLH
ncbi:MAG: HYExAFE family protein [Phycisphaerales bacterium]